MSFNSQEQSSEGGAPIELYTITGSDTFYYTSSAEPYVLNGNTYLPIPISRSAPTITIKETSGSITVNFPFNNPFVARYLGGVPPSPDKISIHQVHLSDPFAEVVPFWSGTVASVKFSGTEAKISMSGVMNRLGAQIPAQTYSWMCDHNLFGSQCLVSESKYTYVFDIVAVSDDGVEITLVDTGQASEELASDISYFNGGTFLTGTDGSQRMGVQFTEVPKSLNTYTLVLLVPGSGLKVGMKVTFTAGCDKAVGTCLTRFNNVHNYGGFPFVPTLNPHTANLKLTEER